MLPDFPEIKKKIVQSIGTAVTGRADQDPVLGAVTRFVQHEGDRNTIVREDGSEGTIDYSEPVSGTVVISTEDIRRKGPIVVSEAINKIAEDLTRGMAVQMFKKIGEAADEIGNTVSANGKPFSADLYLETLRKLRLVFDSGGSWIPPQLVIHPDRREQFISVLEQAKSNPEFISELEKILRGKREEWHAREANRRLVD